MTWRAEDPQGNEVGKVRFDVVRYMKGTVFDLGCGPHKIYPTAIGFDNKIDAKLFGIKITPDINVPTCERLPMFADGAADTVFSSHLLEHIEDHEAALLEWWRLVKVGGYLILYLPHRDHYPRIGQPGANPDHKHDFAPEHIVEAMTGVAAVCGQGWELLENETRAEKMEYSFLQVYRKRDVPVNATRIKLTPTKRMAIVRLGAYGDALWITPALEHYKREGWHITVYAHPQTEEMLRNNPNVDDMIVQPHGLFDWGDGTLWQWQHAYWLHEEPKYDRFLNAVGAVEFRLLCHPSDRDFYLPFEQRHRLMNHNYVEAVCQSLGVPHDPATTRQKFYPTQEEMAKAVEERARIDGPLVVINPAGSSMAKWYPFAQELADQLSAEGIHSRIVGDTRFAKFRPSGKFGQVIGTTRPIREAIALALTADVVVGVESAIVNAVAHEPMLKMVLLSHSSHENLTRDWVNTIAVQPDGLECYPCHRIHADMQHCTHDTKANAAACQSAAKPEMIVETINSHLSSLKKRASA